MKRESICKSKKEKRMAHQSRPLRLPRAKEGEDHWKAPAFHICKEACNVVAQGEAQEGEGVLGKKQSKEQTPKKTLLLLRSETLFTQKKKKRRGSSILLRSDRESRLPACQSEKWKSCFKACVMFVMTLAENAVINQKNCAHEAGLVEKTLEKNMPPLDQLHHTQ